MVVELDWSHKKTRANEVRKRLRLFISFNRLRTHESRLRGQRQLFTVQIDEYTYR